MAPRHNESRAERRRRWFDEGRAAIEFTMKIVSDEDELLKGVWICPLCLRFFSKEAIDVDPPVITFEHVPPAGTGGQAIALTCLECNTQAGGGIDRQAVYHHRVMSALAGEGEPLDVLLTENVPARLLVRADGVEFHLDQETESTTRFVSKLQAGEPVDMSWTPQKPGDERSARLSYLKSAYMVVFARWGYRLVMSPAYLPIRLQLREPGDAAHLLTVPVLWKPEWPDGLVEARHETLGAMLMVGFGDWCVLLPLNPSDRAWCDRYAAEAAHPTSMVEVREVAMEWPTEPAYLYDYTLPVGNDPRRADVWSDEGGEPLHGSEQAAS